MIFPYLGNMLHFFEVMQTKTGNEYLNFGKLKIALKTTKRHKNYF